MPEQFYNQVPPSEKKLSPRTSVDPSGFEHELTEIYLELKGAFTPEAIAAKYSAPDVDRRWLNTKRTWETPTIAVRIPERVPVFQVSPQKPKLNTNVSVMVTHSPIKAANTGMKEWDLPGITLLGGSVSNSANISSLPEMNTRTPDFCPPKVRTVQMPAVETQMFCFSDPKVPVSLANTDAPQMEVQLDTETVFGLILANTDVPSINIQVNTNSVSGSILAKVPKNVQVHTVAPVWEPPNALQPKTDYSLKYDDCVKVAPVKMTCAATEVPQIDLRQEADWTYPVCTAQVPSVEDKMVKEATFTPVNIKIAATNVPEISTTEAAVSAVPVSVVAISKVGVETSPMEKISVACDLKKPENQDGSKITAPKMAQTSLPMISANVLHVDVPKQEVAVEHVSLQLADANPIEIIIPQVNPILVKNSNIQPAEEWALYVSDLLPITVPIHFAQMADTEIPLICVGQTLVPVCEAVIAPCPKLSPGDIEVHDMHIQIPELPEPPDLGLPKRNQVQPAVDPVFFEGVKIMEELGLIEVFAREGIILDLKRGNPE